MSVVNIFNIPGTDEEQKTWSLLHMILHRDMISAIGKVHNVVLPEFILDPWDPTKPGSWFYDHQLMHNQMDGVLGVSPINMVDVKWSDPNERIGWFQAHAIQHQQETQTLGVFA